MNSLKNLHPICIFTYFVSVILLILLCMNPVVMMAACAGALFFLLQLEKEKAVSWLKVILPMILFIALANPLLNHRGVTRLFKVFNQWLTLEALCYGITAALSLAALILWFACYQQVMTSDKFLYLFGRIAPATALLISMALNLVPKLQGQLRLIQECQEMMYPENQTTFDKLKRAIRSVSTLLGWSLENTVEQADSMKARGYGIKRRTTFHLFRFESKDAEFMVLLILLAGSCMIARVLGYGTMEFYPRMDSLFRNIGELVFYILFLALVCVPGILEWKEEILWRSYDLSQ
ncbi:MAG: energy-coupling factor transporter transmembrane component T family protein [Oliverpabstia sp.]